MFVKRFFHPSGEENNHPVIFAEYPERPVGGGPSETHLAIGLSIRAREATAVDARRGADV